VKINKRERIVLSVGLIGAVTIVLIGWVVLPFMDSKKDLVDQIRQKKSKIQSHQTYLQRRGDYVKELNTLRARKRQLQSLFLMVNDSGEAEAKLRDTLNQYAQANGVTITRTNILPEEKLKSGYSKIAIDFNVNADIGPLTRFMYALASNPYFLEIRQLSVNSYLNRNQVVLQPRITLTALVRKG